MRRHLGTVFACSLVVACGAESAGPIADVVPEADAPALLAVETCRSLFDCACLDVPYDGREDCGTLLQQRGDDRIMVAAQNGLRYDGACVSTLARTRRDLGCDVVPDGPVCVDCKPYHGDVQAGQPCMLIGVTVGLDDCAQGLACVDGVCEPLCDAPPQLSEGRKCTAGLEVLGDCVAGLYCEADSQTCQLAPQLDEPCPDRVCTEQTWCDPTRDYVCTATREPGTDCVVDASCQSGRCADGRCADVPGSACGLE